MRELAINGSQHQTRHWRVVIVQCAWCKRPLGTTPDPPLAAITHSICASCLAGQRGAMRRQRVRKAQVRRYAVRRSFDNPGIASSLWGGAKAGYYTYRAGRLEGKAKKYRERARASFAPNPRVIPGTALEVRYRRATDGKLYYHPFKGPVRMVANADGSVTLRGGKRIWADDREAGFWDRYGHSKRRRNPSMARRRRRRGDDNTMLWLLGAGAAFLFWPQIASALGVATGGAVSTGGQPIIPQGSDAIWFSDPYTGGGSEFFVGALPPGSAPPWRLASATEIGNMEAGLLSGYLAQAGGGLVAPAPGFVT